MGWKWTVFGISENFFRKIPYCSFQFHYYSRVFPRDEIDSVPAHESRALLDWLYRWACARARVSWRSSLPVCLQFVIWIIFSLVWISLPCYPTRGQWTSHGGSAQIICDKQWEEFRLPARTVCKVMELLAQRVVCFAKIYAGFLTIPNGINDPRSLRSSLRS